MRLKAYLLFNKDFQKLIILELEKAIHLFLAELVKFLNSEEAKEAKLFEGKQIWTFA